jgi:hypothetical protein
VSVMGLVNHLINPKELAIAHENGPKTQKQWVFGHLLNMYWVSWAM